MNPAVNVSEVIREAVLLLLCVPLVAVARRLHFSKDSEARTTFSLPIVCAAVLWMGTATAVAGALLACWLEARFLLRERKTRLGLLQQGLHMSLAALLAGLTLHFWPRAALQSPSLAALSLAASKQAIPVISVFFTIFYLLSSVSARRPQRRGKAQMNAPLRLNLMFNLCGFAALFLVVPLGAFLGAWAFLPLCGLLGLFALVLRRSSEISRLRGQLRVAQAMGFVTLGDSVTLEPTAILYRFLNLASHLIHSERSLVWIVDETTDNIIPAVGLPSMGDFAGLQFRLGEGLIGSVADRTRPLIVSDAARTLRRSEKEPAADSWLLYPILVHKRIVGIAHWTRPAAHPFTQDEAAQLEALVPQVGVAMEALQSRMKMRELASTDGLTGLTNQRRIAELLREEMRRAERYNRPLSVLMLDVDSFKSFNDTYGHPQGDQLLKSISQILQKGVRTVDKVGRYGGEEFIIVMPETHKDDAYRLAERIRATIEEQAWVLIGGQEIHRTISVGVASFPEDGLNPQEVVERADEALYRAKHAGKNCVIWA